MVKRKRRGGRHRSTAPREPNGRVSRACTRGPAVLEETKAQRAAAMGWAADDPRVEKLDRDARAGTVLGRLCIAKQITDRQFEAGSALADLWRRWAAMAGAPSRHPGIAGAEHAGPRREPSAKAWERADGEMAQIKSRVRENVPAWALAWSLLEAVCVDGVLPPRLDSWWLGQPWEFGWDILRQALASVGDHYRMPAEPKPAKPPTARQAA